MAIHIQRSLRLAIRYSLMIGVVIIPERRKSLYSRPVASPLNHGLPISTHLRARPSKSVRSISSLLLVSTYCFKDGQASKSFSWLIDTVAL